MTVPKDVFEAARAVIGDTGIDDGTARQFDRHAEAIAKAILAERKRCAECCDRATPGHYMVVASNIRRAIEAGE